jgi:hypothetical protein
MAGRTGARVGRCRCRAWGVEVREDSLQGPGAANLSGPKLWDTPLPETVQVSCSPGVAGFPESVIQGPDSRVFLAPPSRRLYCKSSGVFFVYALTRCSLVSCATSFQVDLSGAGQYCSCSAWCTPPERRPAAATTSRSVIPPATMPGKLSCCPRRRGPSSRLPLVRDCRARAASCRCRRLPRRRSPSSSSGRV